MPFFACGWQTISIGVCCEKAIYCSVYSGSSAKKAYFDTRPPTLSEYNPHKGISMNTALHADRYLTFSHLFVRLII
jgi:hypothetical protein